MKQILRNFIVTIVLLALLIPPLLSYTSVEAENNSSGGFQIFQNSLGLRVVLNDSEFYFNASNGGEITEYFDLCTDPFRTRNLVNLNWGPYYNLLPLFTSMFYNPYTGLVLSTGGDFNAMVKLVTNNSEYAILQTSSRILGRKGEIAKDASGQAILVNSTWIVHSNGLVAIERTFSTFNYATVFSGWRWYPFYLTRNAGFGYNGTFQMYNTTYAFSSVINHATYRNVFGSYSILPTDTDKVFGVAMPFSNTSLGGDGTHSVLIAYKYDELVKVNEWRTDNYYSKTYNITEGGAVHEFSQTAKISTHTYHMLANFTHQAVDERVLQNFVQYYADNLSEACVMECSVTSNKDTYIPGDRYSFFVSGACHYSLTGITAKLTVKNSSNKLLSQQNYGPTSVSAGQVFNLTLLSGKVYSGGVSDNYTLQFQMYSRFGIVMASSSKTIAVIMP